MNCYVWIKDPQQLFPSKCLSVSLCVETAMYLAKHLQRHRSISLVLFFCLFSSLQYPSMPVFASPDSQTLISMSLKLLLLLGFHVPVLCIKQYLRQKARVSVPQFLWFSYQMYRRPGMFLVTGLTTVVSYNVLSVTFVYFIREVLVSTFPS